MSDDLNAKFHELDELMRLHQQYRTECEERFRAERLLLDERARALQQAQAEFTFQKELFHMEQAHRTTTRVEPDLSALQASVALLNSQCQIVRAFRNLMYMPAPFSADTIWCRYFPDRVHPTAVRKFADRLVKEYDLLSPIEWSWFSAIVYELVIRHNHMTIKNGSVSFISIRKLAPLIENTLESLEGISFSNVPLAIRSVSLK